MKDKILFINACARHNSRTKELADYLLSVLSGEITEVNLYKENLSPLDEDGIAERENSTPSQTRYARQFADADILVVAAPYWDLSFPSVLKVYLENVTVSGITFDYSQDGQPISKCRAKKLFYITTSGGYIGENNYGFDYVKALATSFYGIEDVRFYSAEGLDIFGSCITDIMKKAKSKISL